MYSFLSSIAISCRRFLSPYAKHRGLTAASSSENTSRIAIASPNLRLTIGLGLLICLIGSSAACAQNTATASQGTQDTSTAKPTSLPKHTETVVVQGRVETTYAPSKVQLAGFEDVPAQQVPLSAFVVTQSVLEDQQARLLSDVIKNDASIGEDYAPIGWYQDIEIRGFPIDTASGFRINGVTIAGEQLIPLENKERVEFLHGLAGLQAGVTTPGGIVNYVTKRPAVIRALDLATDQRGTAFGHLDLGGFADTKQQLGWRLNVGAENMRSYVNDADGSREFGAIAADWKLAPQTVLRGDFEYQHLVQHSVGGYQLLGGTIVPTHIYPSTMLGEQSWAKPNTFDAFNTSVRLDQTFTTNWKAYVTVGRSRSLLDDNVAWPYGSAVDPNSSNYYLCTPYWFFCKDGSYAVYDYRSPGELRINDQLEGILTGKLKSGVISQDIVIGANLMRRSVDLPAAVYDWVGNDNIYQPLQQFQPSTNTPGPAAPANDAHQYALVVNDHIHLPARIDLIVGGQYDTLHDNYKQTDPNTGSTYWAMDKKKVWLPQYSALYRLTNSLSAYATYSTALSLGPQGPFWVANSSQFLPAFFTRLMEIGAKYAPGHDFLLTADIFRMRAPFFYPKEEDDGLHFVSEGRETHRGIEFSAQGKAASWLHLTTSIAAIQGISENTGTPAFDNKQILNLPHFRSSATADISVPHAPGLFLIPGWSYTGRKAATRDDSVSVSGYSLFNLALRYTPQQEHSHVTFRLYADNIGNKRYWKDTGANYGDTFLHVGAPATIRLSAQYLF